MIGTVPARCLSCGQIVTAEVTRKGPMMLAHQHDGARCPATGCEHPEDAGKRAEIDRRKADTAVYRHGPSNIPTPPFDGQATRKKR